MDKEKTSSEKDNINTKKAVRFLLKKFSVPLCIIGIAVISLVVVGVDGMMKEIGESDSIGYKESASYPADSLRTDISTMDAVQAMASDTTATEQQFPMDINAADMQQLMLVKGIGEKTAGDIIAFREQHGAVTSIDQLIEIDGIGEAMIELLKQYFYVTDDIYAEYTTSTAKTTVTLPETKSTSAKTERRTERRTATRRTTQSPKTEPETEQQTETEAPPELDTETATETDPSERERVAVDINHASAEEISECLLLPAEKAEDIVAVREQIGYFSSVSELYLVESLTRQDIIDITDYIIILPL